MSIYRLTRALIAGLLLFGAACGDDPVATTPNNGTPPGVDVPIPQGSRLQHTGACAGQPNCQVDVTYNSSRPLAVKLVDGNNSPVIGAAIRFEINAGDAVGTTLNASSAQANSDGIAQVEIRAGAATGVAEVIVSVPGDASVPPIKFVAGIQPKDSASYAVSFDHAGTSSLRDIRVFLYDGAVSCAAVREDIARTRDDDPNTNPVLTAEYTANGIANVDGTLPLVVFPGLSNGQAFTVSAHAMSRANSEVELAFGCTDGNPPITNGNSVSVLVRLDDYIPRIKGVYDVTHTFSITDAICNPQAGGGYSGVLPSGVCLAIDLLGRLATDPASFIVGQGNGDTGIIGLIVDFLPDNGVLGQLKSAINSFLGNNLIQGLGRDALNTFFSNWINNNAPAWVKGAVNITGDIYASLKEFRVNGIIRIEREPTTSLDPETNTIVGVLAADAEGNRPGKQVWEDIIVYWTGDCPAGAPAACRERTFAATDLGATSAVVDGTFTGTVIPMTGEGQSGFGLIINEHTLALNYGVLILGIIEQVVLPSIFGQNVTSLEAALNRLLTLAVGGEDGCDGLADYIENAVSGGNTVNSIAKNLCNSLLESASDGIRTFLTENLTISGEDNFLLSTVPGKPCTLIEPEIYTGAWVGKPLPYIQSLGKSTMQCEWDVKIRISANTIIDTDGSFYGTRSGF